MVCGLVVDLEGRGFDNATVVIDGKFSLCNEEGIFEIDGISPGTHTVTVVHRDIELVRRSVEVEGAGISYMIQIRRPDVPGAGLTNGILEIKRSIERSLIENFESVIGVGVSTTRDAILVYTKVATGEIPVLPGLPESVGGFPLNIVPMEDSVTPPSRDRAAHQQRVRPLRGGVSAAHYQVRAGTLGAVVTDAETGKRMLLSNNHTFANMSSDAEDRAGVGDPIYQPSALDGGDAGDVVGSLERWVPYVVTGNNLVDAAVASVGDVDVADGIATEDGVIPIRGIRSVNAPTVVRKYGRTTGYTEGKVVDWDFTTVMDYPTGESIQFVDQLLVEMEIERGDSGALLLDENDCVVGLICGATVIDGREYAVANKIRNVLGSLDIEIPGTVGGNTKEDLLFGATVLGLIGFVFGLMTRKQR